MDSEQRFLDRFRNSGEAESVWLKGIFSFVAEHLHPVLSGYNPPADGNRLTGGTPSPDQVSESLVKKIQEHLPVTHLLPVSYRLVSVSELLSRQHLPCVSNLSWSTSQQRTWTKEAELSFPGHRALPRVNLLLIGCLREGKGGEWRLTDNSGSVRCECLSPSPLWLDQPIFLPHWNYIPHNASGQDESSGHVELSGSPALLCPDPGQGLAAGGRLKHSRALGVRDALDVLCNRTLGCRLSVCGLVGSVCPLLEVGGITFFCFWLSDSSASIHVLVKGSGVRWSQCLFVGQSVCVTALRVCVLRGWRGKNILCATDRSEIYPHTPAQYTQNASLSNIQAPPMMSHFDDETCQEAEPERVAIQSAGRIKRSRVIDYEGTVTEVVSEGAGLYVIDRTVGLCLAYQPTLRRKLRAGDQVELHHVHFLYWPCPDFPPSMLCTCLRSTLRITTFSKVGGAPPNTGCPSDGALPRLLLEKNMGVSEYLWACHLSSQLSQNLVPRLQPQCVCELSWKLMELMWRRGRRRDIYCEMLDEPHTCPLAMVLYSSLISCLSKVLCCLVPYSLMFCGSLQYRADPLMHQYTSISELNRSLHSDCWSSVSLMSLLPPGGSSLNRSQINLALAWSCRTRTSNPSSDPQAGDQLRPRPLLLVGVLELPSQTSGHALQLRDGKGAVACVVTETRQEGVEGQREAFNTAWIGCLVCVHQFTMVTERFIQSEFPSYEHLDQDKYITHKHCRVYLQFSLDHLHILSPSVAMLKHLQGSGVESCDYATETEGGDQTVAKKRRKDSFHLPVSSITMKPCHSRPCVSIVIIVKDKEGVAWRNVRTEFKKPEAGLSICFSLRAAVIGPVISWGHDPKNGPMTERETDTERMGKVVLVFSGASARWFPLLQPGTFYRLIAYTQDPSVLIGCGFHGRSEVGLHTDSTLQVQPDWRIHTLTCPLVLHNYTQDLLPSVLSVSEVIDSRSKVVCFQALVSDRISLKNQTSSSGDSDTGVRLTMCDQSGRSLQVYLDLSRIPYPPGLLPGNTLLLSAFQRRTSRTGSVYCSHLPISSITVVTLGDISSNRPSPVPMMRLGMWAGSSEQMCTVAQVKGHMVCFLFLHLQWSCSLCGGIYTQACSSSQCPSTSAVFESRAKLVIDDGTGEAHVWVPGPLVCSLLGLADSQWEGLQRALRVRGHLRVYPRGQSPACPSDDALLDFLLCVCSSESVCRQVTLTCRKQTNQKNWRSEDVKRFSRGERDFMTRMTPPLQLTCLQVNSDLISQSS